MSHTAQLFQNRFPKGGPTCRRQVVIHDTKRHKANQLQSLKLPCRISKLSSQMWHEGVRWHHVESDIPKEGPGTKHPGRQEIVEHQIPSIKVLFTTNNKSHKHPGIRLLSSESKAQMVKQREQKWHSTQEPRTPQKYSPIECDGVQLHQYWMTLLLYAYIRSITALI